MKKDTTVFLTGANGFVGSYIARMLVSRGLSVTGLILPGTDTVLLGEAASNVRFLEGSLDDWDILETGMQGADVVIHAAGSVSMDPSRRKMLQQVNQLGTRQMVNAALEVGVPHFIHISSITAIGISMDPQEIDEDTPWQDSPLNLLYARSKFAAEREVWRASEEGLPMSIINPGLVVGAGKWKETSCKIILDAYRGIPFLPPGSNAFIDVRDLARIVLKAIELGPSGDRLIAAPVNASWAEYYRTAGHYFGKKPPQKFTPHWFEPVAHYLEKISALLAGRDRGLDRNVLRVARGHFSYHSRRPERLEGITFHTLDETLRDTAAAFMDSYPKGVDFAILPLGE